MLKKLLQREVQQYIRENEHSDINQLLLKGAEVAGVSARELAPQIYGRHKSKSKIPEWFRTDNIVFPAKISMEQCSSEQTANYKASIVNGSNMIDLTGGAGVDIHAFSRHYEQCEYVEQNAALCEITSHNLSVLGASNVSTHCTTAEQYLSESDKQYDLIYLDPARRDQSQKKVFRFEDCTPNVVELLPILLASGRHVLVKTSPFLDISQALSQLEHVQEIHVVSVNNECKEVLYLLSKNNKKNTHISVKTVNLFPKNSSQKFTFLLPEKPQELIDYSIPNRFIYEPNSAILKSGGINSLGITYSLHKLHPNSQLFTSESLVEIFPGRIFECTEVLKYDKKAIKKAIPAGKANITTRNFPHDVAQIRKKTGLKDGGEDYLFATTNLHNEKVILKTKKLDNPVS